MYQFNEITKEETSAQTLLSPELGLPFTQSFLYGELQKGMGRKVRRFEIRKEKKGESKNNNDDNSNDVVGFFQVVKYDMPFGKNYLYIPHGPVIEKELASSEDFLKELNKKLLGIAKEEASVFLRFDLLDSHLEASPLGSLGSRTPNLCKSPLYTYHAATFQPKYEWRVNLEKSEEDILKEMHQKTRYNVRLAEKKGVKIGITESLNNNLESFYEIMEKTSKRDGFYLHPKEYYQKWFELAEKEGDLNSISIERARKKSFLVIAKYPAISKKDMTGREEKILAMNFILSAGDTAYFLFGGSTEEHRNLMPSYLIQWGAMVEAKKMGHKWYNFGGVSKDGKIYKSWKNLSIFKKKFGGELMVYSDFYDIVARPFWYLLYKLRKRIKN